MKKKIGWGFLGQWDHDGGMFFGQLCDVII